MLKMKKLLPLLPVLFLAGCYNAPSTTLVEKPRAVGRAHGIDLATDAGQVARSIKDNGIHFVARYYRKPDSRWPTLSANEAKLISSMGLNLVTVWESHSRHPSYFTYSRGYYDAASAYGQAKTVGQPAGSAIYFAVDFDARGADIIPVDQYFRGVAAGFAAASSGKPEYTVRAALPPGTSGRAGPSRISASTTIRTRRSTITAGSGSPDCELALRACVIARLKSQQ
jgi:hypothetical protein